VCSAVCTLIFLTIDGVSSMDLAEQAHQAGWH
jgi:hypothetical protein